MTSAEPQERASVRRALLVTLLFIALTAVMTWPQVEYLGSRARQHQDVFFNLWRLRWFAHALQSAPLRLLDGNIFHPEPRTLTYSDAMIVEGIVGAPLLWLGLPPLLVHNLLLLGAIVASAVGMWVLVRTLTGSHAAGIIAGIIFAFAPYRYEHYMHMELQWTMWIPWAFWALHRTMTEPTWRSGVLTGVFVALQMLSSIYYGVFLITLLSVSGILLLISLPRERMRATVRALVPGALLAMILCGAYAWPYLLTKSELGGRSDTDLVSFSARPSSYLVATPDNVVWGDAFQSRGRAERRLFPGALAVLLAAIGLLLRPPPKVALVYLLACVMAFDMSLGLSGETYRYLYRYVPVYQGFRALARLGIFVVFFLAVLAAWGFMALAARLSMRGRTILATAICLVLLAEYRVRPMELVPYPNSPPPLYEWLARQPKGVVAELPMRSELPGDDPMYSYYSTFHWQPIVNGYSGFYPASYTGRLEDVAGFPDERSLRRLRQDGVRYLVVHLWAFDTEDPQSIARTLHDDFGLAILTQLSDGTGHAIVFGLR